MGRIGIGFSGGPNASDIVDCVKLAEELGYESAWVAEGHGGDQFAALAGAATRTSTIALGTSITSVYVRSAPTIAMAAATVDQLSGGRFILGVGSSHKVQVEPEHGVVYEKPIARVRDTVAIVRALLKDGDVHYQGETIAIDHFDLWFTPLRREIPIYVAAVFSKMMAVCGEIADGAILTRSTVDNVKQARGPLAEGAKRAGRDPNQIPITTLLPTAVAETRAEALDLMRPGLAAYAGYFPRYNRLIAEQGFPEEAAAIAAAWAKGDKAAAERAVADAIIDANSIAGTPGQCRDRLDAYRDAGIDMPIISPAARGPDARARFEAAIRACAPG